MSNLSLKAVLELVDRVTAPLKSIDQHTKQASLAFRQNAKAAKDLERQLGDVHSFRALQTELGKTNQQLQTAQQRAAQLAAAYRQVQNPTKGMTRELERAEQAADKLKATQQQQISQLSQLKQKLQQSGFSTQQFAQSQHQLENNIDHANRALEVQKQRLQQIETYQRRATTAQQSYADVQRRMGTYSNVGMGAGVAGAVVDGAVIKTIKDYASYEDAMLGLARQVPGMRDDNFKLTDSYHMLGNDLQRLSETIPMTTQNLIALAEGGSRMGVVRADQTFEQNRIALLKFTDTIAGAAVAFDLQDQAGQLGEDMGRIASLFKLPISNINDMGDALNWLDDNAQSKGGDIIEVMSRMAGIATQVGMTWQDTAALGSTFLSLGSTRETAGTAGTAMIRELAIAGMQPDSFQEGINRLQLNADQIQTSMTKDATGTLIKVLEMINKLPKDQQTTVTTQLFGKEYGKDAAKLANNIAEYRRQLKLTHDEQAKGSMAREMRARGETLSAQWQTLKNRAFNNSSDLGAGLRGSVTDILSEVNRLLDVLNQWIGKNPQLAASIMKWVAVGGIALTVLSALALLFVAILGPMALLRLSLSILNLRLLTATASAGGFAATLLGRMVAGLWATLAGVGRLALGLITFLVPSLAAGTAAAFRYAYSMAMVGLRTAGFIALAVGSSIVSFLSAMTAGFMSAAVGAWALMAPFLPLIVAVGLLVAAGVLLYQNWAQVAPVFKAVGAAILDGLTLPVRAAIGAINLLIRGINMIPGVNIPALPNLPTYYKAGDFTHALEGTTPAAANTRPIKANGVPALLSKPTGNTIHNNFGASPITITGVTDPKAVGTEVQRQLAANQRQQAARQRSALSDTE